MRKNYCLVLIIMVVALSHSVIAASALDKWKDQILYFVFIDRFHNGDKSNDFDVDISDINGFHGGDIKGLTDKIDYLKNLGITGVWLSPFFTNRPGRFFEHQPYHGYWVYDFWNVDKRFGTEKEFKKLRKKLKKADIDLLLDMVVNHMGYDAPFAASNPQWFNPKNDIEDWNNKEQLTNRQIFGLPDFASQKPIVKTFFKLVAEHWIDTLKPKGFRLDAVKHVNMDFWQDYNAAVGKHGGGKFLLLGEYLDGDPASVNKVWREGRFNSLFDFPLYYTMVDVFAKEGNMKMLPSRLYYDRNYPDAGMLATFLDNHDLDRFITSCGGDNRKYRLALAYLLTSRGIPTLCYGDEQGLSGAHKPEPENRRSMVFDTENDLFKFTKRLIELRKKNKSLRRGLQCHIQADETSCVYVRLIENSLAIMIFNNSKAGRNIEFKLPFKLFNAPKIMSPAMGEGKAVIKQGYLQTFLPAKSFAIYLPKSPKRFYKADYEKWQERFHNEKAWGERKIAIRLKADYAPEGARFYFTGNFPELGNWNSEGKGALRLSKVSTDNFEGTVKMPVGRIFEGKCYYILDGETVWQPQKNMIIEVAEEGTEYIHTSWSFLRN